MRTSGSLKKRFFQTPALVVVFLLGAGTAYAGSQNLESLKAGNVSGKQLTNKATSQLDSAVDAILGSSDIDSSEFLGTVNPISKNAGKYWDEKVEQQGALDLARDVVLNLEVLNATNLERYGASDPQSSAPTSSTPSAPARDPTTSEQGEGGNGGTDVFTFPGDTL